MRVTSKGQVTIPKEVRDKLGIVPGSEVGFREEGQAMVIERADAALNETDGERLVRVLVAFGRKARAEGLLNDADMTTDEYMELIRGYSEDENDPGFKRHS